VLLGQEDHADAVFARGREVHALFGHLLAVQRIGQLDQDAGAVTHQLVGTHRPPVVQVFKNLQALLHDGVRLLALDVRHKPTPQASCSLAGSYRPVCCSSVFSAAVVMAHS
jgi:hypothetical protein